MKRFISRSELLTSLQALEMQRFITGINEKKPYFPYTQPYEYNLLIKYITSE